MTDPHSTFAELLVTHDRQILRYILLFIPQRADAEEVLQRTAVVLWEKFAEYDPTRDFLPWSLRFAYFEVLNYRKQQARSRLIFSEDVMKLLNDTRDEEESTLRLRRSALSHCLAQLRTIDRQLLERRYSDATSIKSLAEEHGRTAKSLYRRLDRLRESLIRCVEKHLAPLET